MNRVLTFICLLLMLASSPLQAQPKRVAMLISSHADENNPELSYDLEELAQAYLVLTHNGLEVEIVSPKGGPVLVKNNKDDLAYIQQFKERALHQLENTVSSADARRADFDGVFIVGGNGAMMDLPKDKATKALLTQFANDAAPIAAVCHGPAAIANLRLADGSYFVSGKQVTSFTNTEETTFSADSVDKFPFMIEDQLERNGATFLSNAPMLPYVAVDGSLITAQNPSSVPGAAEALVLKLGLPLKPRETFKDEAALFGGAFFCLKEKADRFQCNLPTEI